MTPALAAARPRGDLHRVARGTDAWAWPPWAYAGEDGTFGNRFDDPAGEYRLLYASSPRVGAFLETLARYRTDPAIAAEYDEIAIEPEDADRYPTIPPGVVPAGWGSARTIGTARHDGPFADVGHSSSLAELRAALASRLVHYGLDDLDGGDLRRRAPRAFTQEISRYVFERGVTAEGERLVGIRYLSRLGDDIDNWAIFEGTEPYAKRSEEIARDDPDLVAALKTLDLVMAEPTSASTSGRCPRARRPAVAAESESCGCGRTLELIAQQGLERRTAARTHAGAALGAVHADCRNGQRVCRQIGRQLTTVGAMSRTADDHGIDVAPEAERAQAGDASAAAADVPLNEARELLLP